MAVRIKTLTEPSGDMAHFDPGAYVESLDFYECDQSIGEDDQAGLAEFLHYLAFLALGSHSEGWEGSTISRDSSAYEAIASHFGDLDGWDDLVTPEGIYYGELVRFLLPIYPPGTGELSR